MRLAFLRKSVTQGDKWFPEQAQAYVPPPRAALGPQRAAVAATDAAWSTPEHYFAGLTPQQHERGMTYPHLQIYGALAQQQRETAEGWRAPHLLHERGVDMRPEAIAKMSIDDLAARLAEPTDPRRPTATVAQIDAAKAAARQARAAGNRELAAQHGQTVAQLEQQRRDNPPILKGLERTAAQAWIGYAMHLQQHYGGKAHAMWADDPDYQTLSRRLASIPGASDYKKGAMMADQLRRFTFVSGRGYEGNSLPTVDSHVARFFSRMMTNDPEKQAFLNGNNERRIPFFVKFARSLHDDPGRAHPILWDLARNVCSKNNPRCGSCALSGACATGAAARGKELPAGWSDAGIPRQRSFDNPETGEREAQLFDDADQPYRFPEPGDAVAQRAATKAYNRQMFTRDVPTFERAKPGEGKGARKALVFATQQRRQQDAEPALPGAAG